MQGYDEALSKPRNIEHRDIFEHGKKEEKKGGRNATKDQQGGNAELWETPYRVGNGNFSRLLVVCHNDGDLETGNGGPM